MRALSPAILAGETLPTPTALCEKGRKPRSPGATSAASSLVTPNMSTKPRCVHWAMKRSASAALYAEKASRTARSTATASPSAPLPSSLLRSATGSPERRRPPTPRQRQARRCRPPVPYRRARGGVHEAAVHSTDRQRAAAKAATHDRPLRWAEYMSACARWPPPGRPRCEAAACFRAFETRACPSVSRT